MMGLSHQKQLLPYGRDSCFAWNRCHIFMKKAWNLWHESQTTCVLLLNFRTFMETPFALNSLPLRQRARWRVRSQVSWRKTCKASALYTIGIHAFFINLRNPIPLQIHESPPFATPDAKSCFCFPSLWQSKNEPYLFQQGYWNCLIFSSITFFLRNFLLFLPVFHTILFHHLHIRFLLCL